MPKQTEPGPNCPKTTSQSPRRAILRVTQTDLPMSAAGGKYAQARIVREDAILGQRGGVLAIPLIFPDMVSQPVLLAPLRITEALLACLGG